MESLDSYIDVPFNAGLIVIILLAYVCTLHSHHLLLLAVAAATTAIGVFDRTSTAGQMTKVMCLLPLGLGSVLAFLVAGRAFRARYLAAFTAYVNVAVYGNIGMMVATPAGGTLRGLFSKGVCLALFLWIVQLGYHARWRTVVPHDRLFVFTAVSKSWVVAHAVYRFVLLTLPAFGSGRRHRLLEVYSLTLTLALSRTTGLPFECCFGMADTLVVPATAAWSAIATAFHLIPQDVKGGASAANSVGIEGDLFLSGILAAVALFAGANIVEGLYTKRVDSEKQA